MLLYHIKMRITGFVMLRTAHREGFKLNLMNAGAYYSVYIVGINTILPSQIFMHFAVNACSR